MHILLLNQGSPHLHLHYSQFLIKTYKLQLIEWLEYLSVDYSLAVLKWKYVSKFSQLLGMNEVEKKENTS